MVWRQESRIGRKTWIPRSGRRPRGCRCTRQGSRRGVTPGGRRRDWPAWFSIDGMQNDKECGEMDELKFAIHDETVLGTRIKVVGVGGGGGNAVARMMAEGMTGVEFYVLNTDVQALNASPVPNKLRIGSKVTSGLGAGADPGVGRQAALEDTEKIIEILEGADMVFVTAGLGGGTGTGAAPVVASLAKELNALTVAIVTTPFSFEGGRRIKSADKGLGELASTVDTVITVPNDRLLELLPRGTSFFESFRT